MIKVYAIKHNAYDEAHPVTGYVYLHGELCDANEYDLCSIDGMPTDIGVYDCEVIMTDGSVRHGKLQYWRSTMKFGLGIIDRGLVCDANNVVDNEYAQSKFDSKSNNL